MSDTPARVPEPESWSSARERVIVQVIHWGVVLVVIAATTALGVLGDLDKASVTAIFGTVIGHAGTSASQKLSTRR